MGSPLARQEVPLPGLRLRPPSLQRGLAHPSNLWRLEQKMREREVRVGRNFEPRVRTSEDGEARRRPFDETRDVQVRRLRLREAGLLLMQLDEHCLA